MDQQIREELIEIRLNVEKELRTINRRLERLRELEEIMELNGVSYGEKKLVTTNSSLSISNIIYGDIILDMEMMINKKINILINNEISGQLLSFDKLNLISFLENILEKNINDLIEIPNCSLTHIFYQKDINNNWIIKK